MSRRTTLAAGIVVVLVLVIALVAWRPSPGGGSLAASAEPASDASAHGDATTLAQDDALVVRAPAAGRDLPRGRGHVFALCRGHVSKRVRAATLLEAGIRLMPGATAEDEARAWTDFAENALLLQRAEIPSSTPFVVEMTATGSVEVAITDVDGKPIAGASVHASPNVRVPMDGSSLVRWREWQITADANGVARFDDVPPDGSLWLGAAAAGRRMNAADRKDAPSVVVRSGETSKRTIVLEPDEPAPK